MKKTTFLFLLLCFVIKSSLFAQESGSEPKVTDKEWGQLIQYLEKENHTESMKLSEKFLQRFNKMEDTTYEAANLRYMYLYSVSGLLSNKTITKEEGEEKLKPLLNKVFITPGRQFRQNGIFNFIFWKKINLNDTISSLKTPKIQDGNYNRNETNFVVKNGLTYLKSRESNDEKSFYYNEIVFFEDKFFSCVANQKGTFIYSFDTFEFAEQLDVETFSSLHKEFNNKKVRLVAVLLEVSTGGLTMPHFNLRWGLQNILEDE